MLRVGTTVEWNWGNGTGRGRITRIFREDVTRRIKGSSVTRKASAEDPAYLIEQDDGAEVLKSRSELSRAD